jgi:hypothetical protein
MKQLLTVLIFLPLMYALNAQSIKETKVPEKVKKAFASYYPEAQNLKWLKNKENYEVEFTLENSNAALNLSPEGKLLATLTPVSQSELPQNLIDYVSLNFKNFKYRSQEKIVDYEGTVLYKVIITKNKIKKEIIFTNDGHLYINNQ